MTFSNNCVLVCKHYERFYPKPYLCPAGIATIGYGTTHYPNGVKVRMSDAPIGEVAAERMLLIDLNKNALCVSSLLKVQLTQNQFDALTSFAYNVGPDMDHDGIAEGLGDSTLLRLINEGIVSTNPDWKKQLTLQFGKWIWARNPKRKLPGLIARRTTEAFLFTDCIVKYFNN